MQKLLALWQKYKSVLMYVVFGVLTTVVNYLVYFPLFYVAHYTAVVSNIIAWFIAVLFAFITNKLYVFDSSSWSLRTVMYEAFTFFCCRIATGALETAVLYVFVDVMDMNSVALKLIVSFAIIVVNYIGSKLLVFRNK